MSLVHSSLETISEKYIVFSEIDEIIEAANGTMAACREIHSKYSLKMTLDSLYRAYRRYIDSQFRNHGNNKFSISEEEQILGTIVGWSLLNRGLTKRMLFIGIRQLRDDLSNWNPTHWFKRFLRRYRDQIVLRKVKGLKTERICHKLFDDVTLFVNWLEKFLVLKKYSKLLFLNADESILFDW